MAYPLRNDSARPIYPNNETLPEEICFRMIPQDVLSLAFSFLDDKGLRMVNLVSKKWHKATLQTARQKRLFQFDTLISFLKFQPGTKGFDELTQKVIANKRNLKALSSLEAIDGTIEKFKEDLIEFLKNLSEEEREELFNQETSDPILNIFKKNLPGIRYLLRSKNEDNEIFAAIAAEEFSKGGCLRLTSELFSGIMSPIVKSNSFSKTISTEIILREKYDLLLNCFSAFDDDEMRKNSGVCTSIKQIMKLKPQHYEMAVSFVPLLTDVLWKDRAQIIISTGLAKRGHLSKSKEYAEVLTGLSKDNYHHKLAKFYEKKNDPSMGLEMDLEIVNPFLKTVALLTNALCWLRRANYEACVQVLEYIPIDDVRAKAIEIVEQDIEIKHISTQLNDLKALHEGQLDWTLRGVPVPEPITGVLVDLIGRR